MRTGATGVHRFVLPGTGALHWPPVGGPVR